MGGRGHRHWESGSPDAPAHGTHGATPAHATSQARHGKAPRDHAPRAHGSGRHSADAGAHPSSHGHGHGRGHGHGARRRSAGPLDLLASAVAAVLRPFVRAARAVRRRPSLGVAALTALGVLVALVLLVRTCAGAVAGGAGDAAREPEPEAQPVTDPEPEETVSSVTGEGMAFTGPESFPESEAYANLAAAVDDFEAQGYRVGFVVFDVGTGNSVEYNADEPFYSASTLKGPYVVSLYVGAEASGSYLGASDTVRDCLVHSDNNAYESLRRTFGEDSYQAWLREAGLPEDEIQRIYLRWYCDVTPDELASMWLHAYDYLSAGSPDAVQLQGFLDNTEHSCIHAVTEGTYDAWCKPGWYPAGDSSATNDAGIVLSDTGDYVLVVMSDAPSDFEALVPVVDALNMAHGQLTGGATDSLVDEDTVIPVDE